MRNVDIANELLKNSGNIYIKAFIKEYIFNLPMLERNMCEDMALIRLHSCITYLEKVNFDVTGWMLFEIPIYSSYCFLNENSNGFFDLSISDVRNVVPQYLDTNGYLQDAATVELAINKYVHPDQVR